MGCEAKLSSKCLFTPTFCHRPHGITASFVPVPAVSRGYRGFPVVSTPMHFSFVNYHIVWISLLNCAKTVTLSFP